MNKPAIRFAGFTDAWEQRRLGDVADIRTGPFGSTLHAEDYVEDGTPIITTEHFKTGELPEQKYGILQVSDDDLRRLQNYILKTDDIVFSRVGSVDINALITPFQSGWLFSGRVLRVRTDKNIDSQYLHHELSTERAKNDVISRAVGQTMPSINTEILKLTTVFVPVNIEEQHRIGQVMSALDRLLTLHQREYSRLVAVKKSLLQKMFPREGAAVPEIRFAGFTHAWEQRKLGDVATRIVRKNKDLESTLPLTISSIYGLVDQITYFNNRVASRDVSNYYLIKQGEFAYNKSYSDGFPWGSIKRLDHYEMGVLSTLYIVFALDTDVIDSDYLVTYYETDRWHKEVAIRAAEGARNHGLLNISADDFFDTAVQFPKDIAEQRQIGAFFAALDRLLTLHQRELEKLQNIKKSLLEKMFPSSGRQTRG
jgi:type I restriction enzyme S subunit